MTKEYASEILKNSIQKNGSLYELGPYLYLNWNKGDAMIDLDGRFSADDLEVIAYYMRNEL